MSRMRLRLALLACVAAPLVAQTTPLEFASREFDCGAIYDDASVVARFRFRNVTQETVTITRVEAPCACTVARPPRQHVAPGERGVIEVDLDPRLRRGALKKEVFVHLRGFPSVPLTLSARITPVVEVKPASLKWDAVARGAALPPRRLEVILHRAGTRVLGFDPPADGVFGIRELTEEASPSKAGAPRRHVYEITPLAAQRVGVHRAHAVLRTGSAERPVATSVLLFAEIQGDLAVVPPRLNLRFRPDARKVDLRITVSSRSGRAFTIEETSVKGPEQLGVTLTRDIGPSERPGQVRLRLQGEFPEVRGAASRIFRGHLVLRTDVVGEEHLRIPFSGWVQGAGR